MQTEFKCSKTELHCVDSAYLDFQSIEYILLKGLKLIGYFTQIYHVHHVLIEESVFIGKENSGTAVELSDLAATIVSSSFHLNRASGLHRTYFSKWFLVAGVMLVTSSNLTVINSTFDENTAETGGVIYAEQNSDITLSNSAFTGNQVMCQLKCQGGVLHLNGGTLKVSYGTFLNNSAKGFFSEGGVFQLLDGTVSFSYNTFLHNTVEGRRGIISAKRTYILSTSNTFDQNIMEGGVFYTIGTNLHSRDDDFSQNVAGTGGVMKILSGSVILDENYNTASSNGGVIFALETNLSVITCHFNGNSAENLDRVIHLLDNSYLIMINNEIIFNIAESGGVLSLSDVPDVTIIGSRFINNEVKLNGDISVISGQYQTRLSISECEFAKNLAQ